MANYAGLGRVRVYFLIQLVMLLSLNSDSQTDNDKSSSLRLKLKIDLASPACKSKNAKIIGTLENLGKATIFIDRRNLWRFLYFKGPPDLSLTKNCDFSESIRLPRYQVATGDSFEEEEIPSKYVIKLRPNQEFKDFTTISLKDEFFSIPGRYSVRSEYRQYTQKASNGSSMFVGDVESEILEFEIPSCSR